MPIIDRVWVEVRPTRPDPITHPQQSVGLGGTLDDIPVVSQDKAFAQSLPGVGEDGLEYSG